MRRLHGVSAEIFRLLKKKKIRLVLAESCTGGMASAALTQIPGISHHFCGSTVVYRDDSKSRWLGISRKTLSRDGNVTEEVAASMAFQVLKKTPEARLAGAITGHLGPNSPAGLDGLIWMAVAMRKSGKIFWVTQSVQLPKKNPRVAARRKNRRRPTSSARSIRVDRQLTASLHLLSLVRSLLN